MLGDGLGFVRGVVVGGEYEIEVVVVVFEVGLEVVLEYGLELELGPAPTSEHSVLPCRRRTD